MKVTFSIPTTEQEKDQLCSTVRELFHVEPTITYKVTGTKNIDWQHLDTLADLLNAEITTSPFVVFTLDDKTRPSDSLSREQKDFLLIVASRCKLLVLTTASKKAVATQKV